jgi:hypothetical protein
MCVALLTLAGMVCVETLKKATFVRLGIWRPELVATVCWRSQTGKGANHPGAVPASALNYLCVVMKHNRWAEHVEELSSLQNHEPVSGGYWLRHTSKVLRGMAVRCIRLCCAAGLQRQLSVTWGRFCRFMLPLWFPRSAYINFTRVTPASGAAASVPSGHWFVVLGRSSKRGWSCWASAEKAWKFGQHASAQPPDRLDAARGLAVEYDLMLIGMLESFSTHCVCWSQTFACEYPLLGTHESVVSGAFGASRAKPTPAMTCRPK